MPRALFRDGPEKVCLVSSAGSNVCRDAAQMLGVRVNSPSTWSFLLLICLNLGEIRLLKVRGLCVKSRI